MSKLNEESHQAWVATIAKNYKREVNSPFELNMMEARIRQNIQAPRKRSAKLAPAFAILCALTVVFSWTLLPLSTDVSEADEHRYVQVEEPEIRLFANVDFETTDETFLPDDYITISEVMFD